MPPAMKAFIYANCMIVSACDDRHDCGHGRLSSDSYISFRDCHVSLSGRACLCMTYTFFCIHHYAPMVYVRLLRLCIHDTHHN
jgi:hypothetical protein